MFINKPSIVKYTVAGGTVYPFEFKFFEDTNVKVFYVPPGEEPDDVLHLLTLNVDYTVLSDPSRIGGSVDISVPLTNGGAITIQRALPPTRTVDYATRGAFTANQVDADQDYQTYLILDVFSYTDFFIKTPVSGEGDSDLLFPSAVPNGYIKYSADGSVLEADPTIPEAVLRAELAQAGAETAEELAYLESMNSEASALTSHSRASEPENIEVKEYYYDAGTDSILFNTLTNQFSSLHWSLKSGQVAVGLTYQSPWDASTGVYPTTRAPEGVGAPLEPGDLFIVNVSGNISGIDWFVSDWMIRNVSNNGWDRVPQLVDWNAITNIPSSVLNSFTYTSIADVIADLSTFTDPGIYSLLYKYSADVPSNSRMGNLTVTQTVEAGTTFIEQMWKTKDQLFIRGGQTVASVTTWSVWKEK